MPANLPTFDGVTLRAFRESDAAMLKSLSRDPYVPLISTLPGHANDDDVAAYIQRQHSRLTAGAGYSFCIASANTDEALGQAGLFFRSIDAGRATAGYLVAPQARGRNVAGRALTALTRFAWTLPEVYRVELYIEPWNVASSKAAAFAGYECEGLLRSHQVIGDSRVDMRLFAVLRPAVH